MATTKYSFENPNGVLPRYVSQVIDAANNGNLYALYNGDGGRDAEKFIIVDSEVKKAIEGGIKVDYKTAYTEALKKYEYIQEDMIKELSALKLSDEFTKLLKIENGIAVEVEPFEEKFKEYEKLKKEQKDIKGDLKLIGEVYEKYLELAPKFGNKRGHEAIMCLQQLAEIGNRKTAKVSNNFTYGKHEKNMLGRIKTEIANAILTANNKLNKEITRHKPIRNIFLSRGSAFGAAPGIVLQSKKEPMPPYSILPKNGSSSYIYNVDTGWDGPGAFYNGSTRAVDAFPVIRINGENYTIIGKRGNYEGYGLFGGIYSSTKDSIETGIATMAKEVCEESGIDKNIIEGSMKSLLKKISMFCGEGQNSDPRKTNSACMSTTMYTQFINFDNFNKWAELYKLSDDEKNAAKLLANIVTGKESVKSSEMPKIVPMKIDNEGNFYKGKKTDSGEFAFDTEMPKNELFAGHGHQIEASLPLVMKLIKNQENLYKDDNLDKTPLMRQQNFASRESRPSSSNPLLEEEIQKAIELNKNMDMGYFNTEAYLNSKGIV